MGSISKGVAEGGGSKKEQRLAKREAKAKSQGYDSLDQKKAVRKDNFKQALADAFGGGNRGFLTQQDPGMAEIQKNKQDALAKDAAQIGKNLSVGGDGEGPKAGGGAGATGTTEDRSDIGSNASSIFFRKKGWM